MQLLMSDAARARIGDRLAAYADRLDIVTMATDGSFARGGVALDPAAVDPEIFWLSLDLWPAGPLAEILRAALKGSKGKWAQLFSAGIDNPVFAKLMAKGLRLTRSNAQSIPIAEYVLAHAVSLLHPIAAQAEAQAAHDWRRIPFREIGNTRWLLVGYGNIGHEIATRAAAFGADLRVINRSGGDDARISAFGGRERLHDWLHDSDVVVLACALNASTQHIADAAFFAAMRPGALLVNIGRGELIDEAALRAGLDRLQPAHAVLDVFETEPLPVGSWQWDHPQVRVTAHSSNAGDGVAERGATLFLANLERYLAGQPLLNEALPSEVGL